MGIRPFFGFVFADIWAGLVFLLRSVQVQTSGILFVEAVSGKIYADPSGGPQNWAESKSIEDFTASFSAKPS